MDSDDDLAVVSAIIALQSSTKCRRRRRCWATPWLLRRSQYETLLSELGQEDGRGLRNLLRMEATDEY